MDKFLNFDTFIVPKIITFIYWISCIFVILGGIASMFYGGKISLAGIIGGIMGIIMGLLIIRVFSEMTMVIFKINDNLQKIADKK